MTGAPRLLVARRGGLGDALLAAPLLRALRRAHPDAKLAFAGVGEHAGLLQALGVVDAALSTEDLHAAARAGDRGRWPCDAAWLDDPALAAALPATTRVVAFDPRPRDLRPLPLQLADACAIALCWPNDAALAVPQSPAAGAPVVLAPGSGGRAKCWLRERWLALAARLRAVGRDVAAVVGPVESERDDPRRWAWPAGTTFLADRTLPAIAAALASATAFVGNDSGTTHLAAMLGAPTVALFGPTDPRVWAPTGPRVAVLGGNDPAFAVGVDAAFAAVAAFV